MTIKEYIEKKLAVEMSISRQRVVYSAEPISEEEAKEKGITVERLHDESDEKPMYSFTSTVVGYDRVFNNYLMSSPHGDDILIKSGKVFAENINQHDHSKAILYYAEDTEHLILVYTRTYAIQETLRLMFIIGSEQSDDDHVFKYRLREFICSKPEAKTLLRNEGLESFYAIIL